MLRKFLFAMCLLLITSGTALAQNDVKVEFEGRYWITDLTARAKVIENDVGTDIDFNDIGTDVDFKTDFGFKDENFLDGRFTWYMGPRSKLRFAYTQISYSGDKNLKRTIEFGGEIYDEGTRVITELDVKYLRLGWVWQFINVADGKVRFGTLLEAKGFWVDASLEAPDRFPPVWVDEAPNMVPLVEEYMVPLVEEPERFAFPLPIPTIGVALDINPHKMVNIFAEISGLFAGKYGYLLDGEVGIKIIPIKNLSVIGGYRIFDIEAEIDPDFAKLRISGPFIGATLRF